MSAPPTPCSKIIIGWYFFIVFLAPSITKNSAPSTSILIKSTFKSLGITSSSKSIWMVIEVSFSFGLSYLLFFIPLYPGFEITWLKEVVPLSLLSPIWKKWQLGGNLFSSTYQTALLSRLFGGKTVSWHNRSFLCYVSLLCCLDRTQRAANLTLITFTLCTPSQARKAV